MTFRRTVMTIIVVVLALASPSPAGATTLVQTFQDETWDEEPDQTWEEAIEALQDVHPYLVDVRSLDMIRTHPRPGFVDQGLHVTIPQGGFRGFGPYARLPQRADEAWFRYYVFLSDFRPVSSGKLPGPADASGTPTAKGCKPSTTEDPGWSARLMFETIGTAGAGPTEVPIGYYLYHLGQERDCGDEMLFDVPLQQQRWTCIEGHVRMNAPGSTNGMIEAWIDGERTFWRDGLAFRRPGESLGVREMWNNVYFGGAYPTPNELRLVLDEVAMSTMGRVRCIDPFVDDDGSVHEGDLTELYARQLLFGCGERRACPHDRLTRGDFAALVHRLIRTPLGPDAFSDDDGHFAEGAINSLARAGIIRGCDPPANTRVCPHDPITRAQVAAVVRRMLSLPGAPDAFDDDNGHWAEADIDAIAAEGITKGCDAKSYCPFRNMTRGEAGTFTLRIDELLRSLQTLAPLPDWPPDGPPPPKPPEERE